MTRERYILTALKWAPGTKGGRTVARQLLLTTIILLYLENEDAVKGNKMKRMGVKS